jgi:lambda repressor-like predicted transcriptional regulator
MLLVSDASSSVDGGRFLMLTWEDDVEVHALRKHGWSISAIARHAGFDRNAVRKYLAGSGKRVMRA